jgi:hypothetical protein
MKTFLFITPLTPESLLTPLRKALFEIYLKALKKQGYTNWRAILIGEYEKEDGNIKYIKSAGIDKMEKLKDAYCFLKEMSVKPDYIIRLDDDDIISPFALERTSILDFDCYADLYHSFYNITECKIAQQKRPWLPNTVIHKYEHAIAPFGEGGIPLFMHDHSKSWHIYYARKKIIFASRKQPLYLRIISPTTISSGLNKTLNTSDDIDFLAYKKHLASFGKWNTFNLEEFEIYKNDLIKIWEDFSNKKISQKKERKLKWND